MDTVVGTPDPSARLIPVDGVGVAAWRVWGGGDLVPCGTIDLVSGGAPDPMYKITQHWENGSKWIWPEHKLNLADMH